jgi:hypothetical protein
MTFRRATEMGLEDFHHARNNLGEKSGDGRSDKRFMIPNRGLIFLASFRGTLTPSCQLVTQVTRGNYRLSLILLSVIT